MPLATALSRTECLIAIRVRGFIRGVCAGRYFRIEFPKNPLLYLALVSSEPLVAFCSVFSTCLDKNRHIPRLVLVSPHLHMRARKFLPIE